MPDWQALYPFESREIQLDGRRYHYLDEGQGEVLLLVHGNPTWSFYWRELIRELRKDYRVIAVDHMGCGFSDKPRDYDYRLAKHIDNLTRLIDAIKLDKITLLAHDWGGPIGLGAAIKRRQQFSRFVLFNTAAFRSQSIPWRIRVCRTPILGQVAVQGLNLFARAALSMAVCHHERMTQEVCQGLLDPYDSWENRQAIYRFVEDIPLALDHPSYSTLADIEWQLPSLADHPWMFIWGMQDWCFTPAFLDRFVEIFPRAEVHRLADAGHYVIEDAHERIVPLVRQFLERNACG